MTCGMVKHDYKMQDCCHNPVNAIQIHHVFHTGMESSLHEGDQNWKLPHPTDEYWTMERGRATTTTAVAKVKATTRLVINSWISSYFPLNADREGKLG